MIINNNLGKVAVKPRGEFDERQTYNYLDIITSNGSSYLVLQTVTGATPPNENFYQLMALSGDAATVADEFDSTLPYSKGDYCIYNGELFRFNSDKNAGGWDGSIVDQVVVCGELNNRIEKSSFENAGIHNREYVTEVDTTSVTTVYTDLHQSYYAVVADERGDNLVRGKMYRITFDGVEYYAPALRWFWNGSDGSTFWSKGVTFIGNLSLFCDASGFYGTLPDVPFVITNIYSLIPLVNEKIFLFTESAGQHSVKIERIDYDMTIVPNSLVWGNEISPIYEKIGDGGTNYTGICVGLNDMKNRKSTVAVGFNNTMNGQAGIILGNDNTVNGQAAVAVGNRNEASGTAASAFGYLSKASGSYAESHGYDTTSSGMVSTSHGFRTISNHRSQFVFGEYNVADDSSAAVTAKGNYVEIVGNGAKDAPSNARTLDWSGNEELAGSLTLGLGTANEVTITPQQLTQLLALLSN